MQQFFESLPLGTRIQPTLKGIISRYSFWTLVQVGSGYIVIEEGSDRSVWAIDAIATVKVAQ